MDPLPILMDAPLPAEEADVPLPVEEVSTPATWQSSALVAPALVVVLPTGQLGWECV